MIYLKLFLSFLYVGCFAFGGGYGAVPLVRDVVLSHGWMTETELSYMIAIGESTPGPIMVNMATYVGQTQGGIFGAFLATFGAILPAFVIVLLVMFVFEKVMSSRITQAALKGLKPCIIGIILATGIFMTYENLAPFTDVRILALTGVLGITFFGMRYVLKKKFSPIMLILISACLGMIIL